MVPADGLITDRRLMHDSPPDILLTNYKMLDHLLLRPDRAMLLRRLGLAVKSYWTDATEASARLTDYGSN